MEAIISYIENLFSSFPDSEKTRRMKKCLIDSSQDRYYDLKNQGKSENEAVGAVISEFGGIEEIKRELNINGINSSAFTASDNIDMVYMDEKLAAECVEANKKAAIFNSIGTFFCIVAVALFMVTQSSFIAANEILSIGTMLMAIAVGVVLFIFSYTMYNPKAGLKEENISLSNAASEYLGRVSEEAKVPKIIKLCIGIMMEITSPIIVLVGFQVIESEFAVAAMLFWIAVGVVLLIQSSEPSDTCNKLLGREGANKTSIGDKKSEKANGIFNAILWPLAAGIFLFFGFVNGAWGTVWIVWPISGILAGIFGAVTAIIYRD